MRRRRIPKLHKDALSASHLLFLAWLEAGEQYSQIRSGAALARCIAARRAWYLEVWGEVPPLKIPEEEL